MTLDVQPAKGTSLGSPRSAGRFWFARPAQAWFEALPIGNGRLGGMVYSGLDVERIQLSESTAWSGSPSLGDIGPTAKEQVPVVRQLLFDGRYADAQRLAQEHLLGRPTSFGTNLPLPEVRVSLQHGAKSTVYRRTLDLATAVVRTTYRFAGRDLEREAFCSNPDGVMVVRLELGEAGRARVEFGPAAYPVTVSTPAGYLQLTARATETLHSNGLDGVGLAVVTAVVPAPRRTGTVGPSAETAPSGDAVEVSGADEVMLVIAVATTWDATDPVGSARAKVDAAVATGFIPLKARHTADHATLQAKAGVYLGTGAPGLEEVPTDERRCRFAGGSEDPELLSLMFDYGRYLTIAGSRQDSPLPLALQGLWNDGKASSASWTNDFHLDVNTEQNYWAAEPTGLGECQAPLIRLIHGLREAGQRTAAELYGAPGWVAHTVTNAWGYTAPGRGPGWGTHVTAGIWIALQAWDHYDYSRDPTVLADVYPVFRDAARFFLSYLTREPTHGWLVTGPSDSPENWYLAPGGAKCATSMGATCDRVFVEALFRVTIEAATALDCDADLCRQVGAARSRLLPFQVGRHGQLQEWMEDFEEAIPNHRHTTHLAALYPERQIDPRTTPELARAATITIERRLAAEGWEQTEWAEAQFAMYFARLLEGDRALHHVRALVAHTTKGNLLTFSQGGVAGAAEDIYSFDGNAGLTAAIAEMLVQGDGTTIELLPALPGAWPEGHARGIRVRGGVTIDIDWSEGRLERAVIAARRSATLTIRCGSDVHDAAVDPTAPLVVSQLQPHREEPS